MAADYIVVTKTKLLGAKLVAAADRLRELRELVDLVNDAKDHNFTGGDFSALEQQFGLATGQGSNVSTLIGLIQTIFNTNTDVTGANRLSQLDEFAGRLAGQ